MLNKGTISHSLLIEIEDIVVIESNCIRCPFTVSWSSPSSVAFARPIRTESISELSACIVSNPTSFLISLDVFVETVHKCYVNESSQVVKKVKFRLKPTFLRKMTNDMAETFSSHRLCFTV
jgi:hypothetical protein